MSGSTGSSIQRGWYSANRSAIASVYGTSQLIQASIMMSTSGPAASRSVRISSTFFAIPSRPSAGPQRGNHLVAVYPLPVISFTTVAARSGSRP